MNAKYTQAIDEIAEKGWSIIPNFLDAETVKALLAEQRKLIAEGAFRQAGIGKGLSFQVRPEIRSDHVMWMEPDNLTHLQKAYWDKIDELRTIFNQEFYLGLKSFECHFALYPKGSFYKKHLDQHKQVQYRIISCVFYLNDEWQPEDGGRLRIYEGESDNKFIDIDPIAGTLVCFKSAEVHHEVLPTNKERYSITGWLRINETA